MSNFRVGSSAETAISVTPSDTVNITNPMGETFTKGLYIGTSGDISVVMADGGTITFTSISAGTIHPISVVRVNATGTTASGIVAVY